MKVVDFAERRDTTTQMDLLDVLSKWVPDGRVESLICLVGQDDGDLLMWTDLEENDVILGRLERAKLNFVHSMQHN